MEGAAGLCFRRRQGGGAFMEEDLFGLVTDATGLPDDLVSNELTRLLQKAGIEREAMTLDDLRQILAEYVQDVLLEAKDKFSEPQKIAAGE